MKNHKFSSKYLVISALFAALIFATTYTFKIPSPFGYVHIGDAFIYLAGAILPTPFAIASAAIGAALSDGIGGYFIYIIPTIIIKALTALFFSSKSSKIITTKNLIALVPALILCVGGYYLFEGLLYSNFVAPLQSIIGNIGQVAVSVIIFVLVGYALDKMKFKEKINL